MEIPSALGIFSVFAVLWAAGCASAPGGGAGGGLSAPPGAWSGGGGSQAFQPGRAGFQGQGAAPQEGKGRVRVSSGKKGGLSGAGRPSERVSPGRSLPEVVVTASRMEEDPFRSPRAVSVVDREEVERRLDSASTAAELLRGEPGVFVQQTGRRGGAPIIRGLIGKFILPMYDGIRLTDGTIFAGPNSFFNNVDRLTIDHIEIVRGPASVLYGSDAIGGTINMIPKRYDRFPGEFELHAGARTIWESAANQYTQRVEAKGGRAPFNFYVGGTFVDSDDVRGGRDLDRLSNTSWREKNVDARLGFDLGEGQLLEASYWRTQKEDVYRFDQPWKNPHVNDWWRAHTSLYLTSAGLRKRMAKTPLSTTQLASLSYKGKDTFSFCRDFQAKLYWRGESEKRVRGSEQTATTREDRETRRRDVFGAGAQFTSPLGRKNRVVYGFQGRLDEVDSGRSVRETFDKATGRSVGVVTRTPRNPDARVYDLGVFLLDEYKGFDKLTLSAGLRFNYTKITSDPTASTTPSPLTPDQLDIDADFSALTWSLGAVYELTRRLNAVANVASGFRSPSVSDMLRTGAFSYGVGVPSPGLDPEKAITWDLGLKARSERFQGSLTGFYTDLRDLIESKPGTFGGSDFIDLNGDGIKQADEQVYVKENVGKAYVWGFEAEGRWKFLEGGTAGDLFLMSNATFTKGRDRTNHEPLRFIPPLNGIVGLLWERRPGPEGGRRMWAELISPWSLKKREKDFSSSDLRDKAQFPGRPGRLPGWMLLHLRAGIDTSENSTLTFSITNLLDKEYQSFASRIPGDGRSFNVSFQIEW